PTPGVGFVMARDGPRDYVRTARECFYVDAGAPPSGALRELLVQFDDPAIVARQLHKLNSFDRSGDLIIFGAFGGKRQVNFENQIGGHGSLGGEQQFPFILTKRAWGLQPELVEDACELHPQLKRLRDALLTSQPVPAA